LAGTRECDLSLGRKRQGIQNTLDVAGRPSPFQGNAHQHRFIDSHNDLIVTWRHERKGTHWSLESSDALVALQTLMLNNGWELYRRYW
jgi:hypothetical protein